MTIIERLDLIERLVTEQKPPVEIRGHILAIREAVEAHSQEVESHAALRKEHESLKAEHEKLKLTQTTPPPDTDSYITGG